MASALISKPAHPEGLCRLKLTLAAFSTVRTVRFAWILYGEELTAGKFCRGNGVTNSEYAKMATSDVFMKTVWQKHFVML